MSVSAYCSFSTDYRILNKVTAENFTSLSQHILNINVESPEALDLIVQLIFQKAANEPTFTSLYADFCLILSEKAQRCEDEFTKRDKIDPSDSSARRRYLGGVRFIAELGRNGTVPEKVLHDCVKILLSRKSKIKQPSEPHDPSSQSAVGSDVSKGHSLESDRLSLDMECLCQFLKVVGQHMDTEKARYLMDQYFERMRCILERGTPGQQNRLGDIKAVETSSRPSTKGKSAGNKFLPLDTRIRFMMKDVIELRQNLWVPRYTGQQTESTKPKFLSEIRRELEAKTGTALEPSRSERSPAHRDVPGSGYHPSDGSSPPFGLTGLASSRSSELWGTSAESDWMKLNQLSKALCSQRKELDLFGSSPPNNGNYAYSKERSRQSFNSRNSRAVTPITGTASLLSNNSGAVGGSSSSFRRDNGDDYRKVINGGTGGARAFNASRMSEAFARFTGRDFETVSNGSSASSGSNGVWTRGIVLRGNSNNQMTGDSAMLPRFQRRTTGDQVHKPEQTGVPGISSSGYFEVGHLPDYLSPKAVSGSHKSPIDSFTNSLMGQGASSGSEGSSPLYLDQKGKFSACLLVSVLSEIRNSSSDLGTTASASGLSTRQLADEAKPSQASLPTSLNSAWLKVVQSLSSTSIKTSLAFFQLSQMLESDAMPGSFLSASYVEDGDFIPVCGEGPLCDVFKYSKEERKRFLTEHFKNSKIDMGKMLPGRTFEVTPILGSQAPDRMLAVLEERSLTFLVPGLQVAEELSRLLLSNLDTTVDRPADENASPLQPPALSPQFAVRLEAYIEETEGNVTADFVHSLMATVFERILRLGVGILGFLLRCFVNMYYMDLVDEATFLTWKEEVDQNYPAKGQALFEVIRWLLWLETAEEEEENEEAVDNAESSDQSKERDVESPQQNESTMPNETSTNQGSVMFQRMVSDLILPFQVSIVAIRVRDPAAASTHGQEVQMTKKRL
ncbi:unnamed protein product [Dibothriocephalus latus]|uniref:Eukaryotic translation initiation factor 4 gamma 2 n=1 Tax=Dibothriocephalus latus TaxID=60516 RepID=A0A3P7KWS2_DIBLA|nr:unnamed protein product [Dibothriocephalus latus]